MTEAENPEVHDSDEEAFYTVGDMKKALEGLPDDMEVTAVVILPVGEDGDKPAADDDEGTHYIPISAIEDLNDEETGEKSIGLVINVESYLNEDDDEGPVDDEEPVDAA